MEIPKQLFCQVCGETIPDEKAKRRSNTCGKKECVNALRRFRSALLNSGKCPSCYHPSTPEEWQRYQRWRRWEAKQTDTTLDELMKSGRGQGPKLRSVTRKLIAGLELALKVTEERRRVILEQGMLKNASGLDLSTLPEQASKEIATLDEKIVKWGQLLDLAKSVLPEKAVDAQAPE